MDLILWGVCLLLAFFLFYRPIREGASGYQDYDVETCLSVASQNEQNIKVLQGQVTQLLALQDQITNIQNQNNANTQTLSQLTTQVMSTS
jgi:hypothetical protein